ncbi:hypothetical protein F5887DRAFT_999497 [Amanita rubescens]|nr:hypothetical protein F5887DRAFT_999497 [Amanita rubescens]
MPSAPTSLCPGFRLVEEFDPNEEYEDDEEISYVTFDLGNIEPTLVPSSSTYRLIDRSQRSVAYVASAEQRVAFKEVRLQPKENAKEQAHSTRQVEANNQIPLSSGLKTAGSSGRSKRIEGIKPKKRTKGKAKATNDHEEVPDDAMDASAG